MLLSSSSTACSKLCVIKGGQLQNHCPGAGCLAFLREIGLNSREALSSTSDNRSRIPSPYLKLLGGPHSTFCLPAWSATETTINRVRPVMTFLRVSLLLVSMDFISLGKYAPRMCGATSRTSKSARLRCKATGKGGNVDDLALLRACWDSWRLESSRSWRRNPGTNARHIAER